MIIAAREALPRGCCEVVGGFIRDLIIMGNIDQVACTPKDINLRFWEWQGFGMDSYIMHCESWGLSSDDYDCSTNFSSGHQAEIGFSLIILYVIIVIQICLRDTGHQAETRCHLSWLIVAAQSNAIRLPYHIKKTEIIFTAFLPQTSLRHQNSNKLL